MEKGQSQLSVRVRGEGAALLGSARGRTEGHGRSPGEAGRARHRLDAGRLEITSAYRELEAAREIVATERKALELAREGLAIAEISYENGVITSTELNDVRLSLLETEWELMQSKYNVIVAAAKTKFAAGIP